jgi:hypothetical protein
MRGGMILLVRGENRPAPVLRRAKAICYNLAFQRVEDVRRWCHADLRIRVWPMR